MQLREPGSGVRHGAKRQCLRLGSEVREVLTELICAVPRAAHNITAADNSWGCRPLRGETRGAAVRLWRETIRRETTFRKLRPGKNLGRSVVRRGRDWDGTGGWT